MKDILQGFAERFAGPVYAYLTTSIVLFNWKWIALLFMSKYPVEVRIAVITQYFDWIWGLVIPVISGCLAASLTPYLNILVSLTHQWAKRLKLYADDKTADQESDAIVNAAKRTAKIESAHAIEKARFELKQKIIENRSVRVVKNIKAVREEVALLKSEHSDALAKFKIISDEVRTAMYMLETIRDWAEEAKVLLPPDSHISDLIKARGNFIKAFSIDPKVTENFSWAQHPRQNSGPPEE